MEKKSRRASAPKKRQDNKCCRKKAGSKVPSMPSPIKIKWLLPKSPAAHPKYSKIISKAIAAPKEHGDSSRHALLQTSTLEKTPNQQRKQPNQMKPRHQRRQRNQQEKRRQQSQKLRSRKLRNQSPNLQLKSTSQESNKVTKRKPRPLLKPKDAKTAEKK